MVCFRGRIFSFLVESLGCQLWATVLSGMRNPRLWWFRRRVFSATKSPTGRCANVRLQLCSSVFCIAAGSTLKMLCPPRRSCSFQAGSSAARSEGTAQPRRRRQSERRVWNVAHESGNPIMVTLTITSKLIELRSIFSQGLRGARFRELLRDRDAVEDIAEGSARGKKVHSEQHEFRHWVLCHRPEASMKLRRGTGRKGWDYVESM